MCNGFSGFYHKDGTVFFIEPDNNGNISHSDVLERLPDQLKKDSDLVAFEFPNWTIKSFCWDHPGKIPDWADKNKCVQTFRLVKPIWLEYQIVRYHAYTEYQKVCYAALAEYQKVCDAAWAEYQKVCYAAWAEYQKVCDAALAEYQIAHDAAWDDMINGLSKIDGYLKLKR